MRVGDGTTGAWVALGLGATVEVGGLADGVRIGGVDATELQAVAIKMRRPTS